MKTKLLALLLILVMAVGMLAACGGGSDVCTVHVDANGDGVCDNEGCGAEVAIPKCEQCVDEDGNGKCDVCKRTYNASCKNHADLDGDGLCDSCGERYDVWDDNIVEWGTTSLIFKLTENSNHEELPSTCHRYMAGDEDKYGESIDVKVRARNEAAYEKTKVSITYKYYTDDSKYNWGQCIEDIKENCAVKTSESPDMYCNFVYDMVAASLNGSFANLYSTKLGQDALAGVNYFQFTNPEYKDSGSGYMVEYMKSLTLSKHKMYCLSSDYFTDMVRAFFVVPVNIKLINSIQPSFEDENAYNYDRTDDGKFNIEDFYELVKEGKWTYTTLAQFSEAITVDSGTDTTTKTLDDTIGFALSSSSGLSSSGMMYTTPVTIINKELTEIKEADGSTTLDYIYYYPNPNDPTGAQQVDELVQLCNNIATLFGKNGVISVDSADSGAYTGGVNDSLQAIRNCFAKNTVLFGGVICLGSLEYDQYQDMKDETDGGFGVAPVPLYRDVNPTTGKPDNYLTQIHNVGRIGAIAKNTLKFAQCTAFLDYMSTHSTDILNEYYNYKLKYDLAGGNGNGNAEMLEYIRKNVRSSFDKAFEDAIGKFFSGVDTESNKNKWHQMLIDADYKLVNMSVQYKELYVQKETYLKTIWDAYPGLPE